MEERQHAQDAIHPVGDIVPLPQLQGVRQQVAVGQLHGLGGGGGASGGGDHGDVALRAAARAALRAIDPG